MWIKYLPFSWWLLSLWVTLIHGDTVFYTNSPRHLVTSENYTSYKLAVPGANPITIIEATQGPPNEDGDPAMSPGSLNEMRRQNWIKDEEFLFRRKNYDKERQFGNNNHEEDEEKENQKKNSRTTVYSPDLLKKFLDDYATKVKKTSGGEEQKEKLQEILLFDDEDEMNNLPLNSRPEEKYNNRDTWSQNKNKFDTKRYDRPNSGWVTMDVIPWSSSKVSKWQGHIQRLPNRPHFDDPRPDRPDYGSVEDYNSDRYQSNYRPNRPSYNDFDDVDRYSSPSQSHSDRNKFNKYQGNRPYYDYQTSSSNNHNSYHSHSGDSNSNKDIYRPWRGDIITDNRAPDFPDHPSSSSSSSSSYTNNKRRPGPSIYEHYGGESSRPSSYDTHRVSRPTASPESGNGEWILVSTTKGYHVPRHGQRAIAMKPSSFTTHKSVQLDVRDPKESTFSFDHQNHPNNWDQHSESSSVIQVQATADKKKKKTPIATTTQKKKVLKKVTSPGVDSSAVLAAVGAGMVPATVAMLMPMIAGRKKRRKRDVSVANSARNVTHFPDLDYEETLQRILQRHVRR